jgi:hypothetical protein
MKRKCLLIKKKAKNNIDKIYKAWKHSKYKAVIILLILLPLFLIGTTAGRYVYVGIRDFYLASKNFYFNSDKLNNPIARYQVDNWSAVEDYPIIFNMNSYANNKKFAKSDITYTVSYQCSSNLSCQISGTYGTIPASTHTNSFTITLHPEVQFQDGDEAWLEVTATSTSPYRKTITGRFVLKVGKMGIYYEIVDKANQPYFDLNITNTLDYYVVKTAFDGRTVGSKIDIDTYLGLSDANKAKCASTIIDLTFNPNIVLLDMTNVNYLNSTAHTTTTINNYNYINGLTFKVDALSSTVVRFYKQDATANYTYPFVTNTPIVTLNHD